ncbi:MAG: IS607 family transposase [Candidatus Helarchaeota archaeon]|nr:IS607 family transposase [Candidatus Helarchaeota archaeon]
MITDKLLRMKEVANLLGVDPQTLRNWSNEGYIEAIMGKGGHRRFKLSEVRRIMKFDNPRSSENICLIYCRVSTTIQRANLKRQRARLQAHGVANGYIIEKIYEDIASGMNFKRRGLLKLLKHCQTPPIKAVIIEFKDRLARFGVELIQEMLYSFGTELVFVNRVGSDYKQEIIDDMIAIMVHFSSRLHGKRRGWKKSSQIKQILKHPKNSSPI